MTDSRVALGLDRLPWLPDEPCRRAPAEALGRCGLLGWVAGRRSCWSPARPIGSACAAATPQPSTSAASPQRPFRLPEAVRRAAARSPTAGRAEVEPIVAPPIPIVEPPRAPRARPRDRVRARRGSHRGNRRAAAAAEPAHSRRKRAGRAGSGQAGAARPVSPARGRCAWSTARPAGWSGSAPSAAARQAKKGWWAIVAHQPGAEAPAGAGRAGPVAAQRPGLLPAADRHHVAGPFEVLCQRMRMIGQSCVVVGLPEARRRAMSDQRSAYDEASCRGCRRSRTRTSRAAFRRARCSPRCWSCCSPRRSSPRPSSGSAAATPRSAARPS